jgi:hypothetical protein
MLSMILTSSFQDRVVGNGNRSYDWIGMKEEEAEARPKLHTKKCLAASGCCIANSVVHCQACKIMQIAHFSAILVQFYSKTLHKTAPRISHVDATLRQRP